jgi:hypothetical protein
MQTFISNDTKSYDNCIKTYVTTKKWIGCLKPSSFAFACEVKSNLMVDLEAIFQNQVKGEDYLDLMIPFDLSFFLCVNGCPCFA